MPPPTREAPSPSPSLSPSTFATAQLSLLAAELAAETASTTALLGSASASPKTLARAGLAIPNLVVVARRTGLGGKTVLELRGDPAIGGEKEESGSAGEYGVVVRPGDVVRVAPQPKGAERKREKEGLKGKGVEGVVVRVGRGSVQVAVAVAGKGQGDDDGDGDGDVDGRVWV